MVVTQHIVDGAQILLRQRAEVLGLGGVGPGDQGHGGGGGGEQAMSHKAWAPGPIY